MRIGQRGVHVESSLKFFVDAQYAGAAGIARFVDPYLNENLAFRLDEARRKLQASRSANVRQFLLDSVGATSVEIEAFGLDKVADTRIETAYVLHGYVFAPVSRWREAWNVAELNDDCCRGWCCATPEEVPAGPGARVAVLSRLFSIGPARASGNPPALEGDEILPGHEQVNIEN